MGVAYHIHRQRGPWLLESVYHAIMKYMIGDGIARVANGLPAECLMTQTEDVTQSRKNRKDPSRGLHAIEFTGFRNPIELLCGFFCGVAALRDIRMVYRPGKAPQSRLRPADIDESL